jgi:hypothetical protein
MAITYGLGPPGKAARAVKLKSAMRLPMLGRDVAQGTGSAGCGRARLRADRDQQRLGRAAAPAIQQPNDNESLVEPAVECLGVNNAGGERWLLEADLGPEVHSVPPSVSAKHANPNGLRSGRQACSDDFEQGVNFGVGRFGFTSAGAATTIKQLCDALASAGTPNPSAEGLAVTECDVRLANSEVFIHVTVENNGARAAASEACLRLNKEPPQTHLYWFR